jgi:hypothetical protein
MLNTLEKVVREWDWQSAWGWDFPLAAMNAASMGYQDLAADLLLMDSPKNRYLLNGHNYQDRNLSVYLPGNGALLTAIAMMCTFRNERNENGFPLNGKWNITYENIHDSIKLNPLQERTLNSMPHFLLITHKSRPFSKKQVIKIISLCLIHTLNLPILEAKLLPLYPYRLQLCQQQVR